eukprot:6479864-Amphidinium_carterae.1
MEALFFPIDIFDTQLRFGGLLRTKWKCHLSCYGPELTEHATKCVSSGVRVHQTEYIVFHVYPLAQRVILDTWNGLNMLGKYVTFEVFDYIGFIPSRSNS